MIAYVRGEVARLAADAAVIDVGGIGLTLLCSPGTLARLHLGQEATLPATLIVREDSLTLFGFSDVDERTVFDILQTVTGVGPRLAQAMLAVLSPDAIRRAVATEDLVALTRVPGVGRKGAQRLVLELKDRLGPPLSVDLSSSAMSATSAMSDASASMDWQSQVHAGLVGLGWPIRDADIGVAAVAEQAASDTADGTLSVATLLRSALRSLNRT